ncbi:MAG: RloB domain-containing protein [Anaerolineales bacterium]|nr:RloB domain-containing protein [Anaerolineales bacterium]
MPKKRKPSGRGYQSRRVGTREPLQRFLLVCEGEKTEPAYFYGFRMPTVKIEIVGLGKDPVALIDRAVDQRGKGEYDQVWCVFDRDDVPAERFNQARALARRKNIEVAYSNQAFELWYLLHFHYCDVAQTRRDYVDGLSRELGRPYQKNDHTLYQELLPRQEVAFQNARRLFKQYNPSNPAADDPSTTVHLLVQELNRFVRR